jgi:hypothetical protein
MSVFGPREPWGGWWGRYPVQAPVSSLHLSILAPSSVDPDLNDFIILTLAYELFISQDFHYVKPSSSRPIVIRNRGFVHNIRLLEDCTAG